MLEIQSFNFTPFLKGILDLTNELIIIASSNKEILGFSHQLKEYYGWNETNFIGKNLNEIFLKQPKYIPFLSKISNKLDKLKKLKFEDIITLHGNESRIISWTITLIKEKCNKKSCYVFLGKDITDKINIQKQKKQIQKYLESISESMPGNFYWKNKESYYLGCNSSLLQTLGFSSVDDIVRKTDFDLWPEQAEELRKNDKQVMTSGKPISLEERVKMKNGEEMYFAVIKIPLLDEKGKIVGIVGNSLNITELKKTQLALKEAKEKAESANKSKSEFIANMNHDLRTPLTGIIGMAEAIIYKSQEQEIKEDAKDILKSGQRLLEFANNILQEAQLDAKNYSKELKLINFKKIMRDLKELFMPSVIQKKLQFDLDYDNKIPRDIYGNPELIYRIAINLLSNAIKFTDSGRITLQVKYLKTISNKIFITLSIADTGIGIAKENLGIIFEPFKKLSSSYKGIYKGTGLGLHLVKQIAIKLEGSIEIQSEPGKGSVFTVTIPFLINKNPSLASHQLNHHEVVETHENTQSVNPNNPLSSSHQSRVLVVEDDEIAGKVLSSYLRDNNCNVHVVSLGKSAIHNFKNTRYDLVYMDIGLPDIDGREVTQAIRRWEKEEGKTPVPIIALTAHLDGSKKKTCLASGLNLVLNKPISHQKIKQHILRYIKKDNKSKLVTSKEGV